MDGWLHFAAIPQGSHAPAMTFWIIVYAIGAAQAGMLALALWRHSANARANRVLAAMLAIVAIDLAIKAAHVAAPHAGFSGAFRVVRLLPFLYPVLFYLYVRTLTTGRGPSWSDVAHAGGFLLALAWAIGRVLGGAPLSIDGAWDSKWFDPLLFALATAYLTLSLWQIGRYRRRLRRRRSDADRLSLRWLVTMAACQFVIWTIAFTHWLTRLPYVDYFLIYGAVAAWVCVVGWFSLGQPPVVETGVESEPPDEPAADDPRLDHVQARLSALMSDHGLYREPALTVAQLAKRCGYPEYLVSAAINRRFGGNFWEYVNRYRVEAARATLADPADGRTILDIAYDAGFTSKSTFNTAFKRLVGETPSAYRRRHTAPSSR